MRSHRRGGPATRLGARLMLFVVVSAGLGGCGVGVDGSPRDISAERQDALDDLDTPDSEAAQGDSLVYLLRESSSGDPTVIRAVHRDVNATAAAIMESLLAGPTASEQGARLSTAIPPDTQLLGVQFIGQGVLAVDLSDEILSTTGDTLVDAVAQIVLSMTQVERVEAVKLLVEGRAQQWPRGDGVLVSSPLTEYDFPGRVETTQPNYPPIPSPVL